MYESLENLIKRCINDGRFTIKPHSLPHRLKEGFGFEEMITTVQEGRIIENYPERSRCLFYAEVETSGLLLPFHVLCDYSDSEWIDIVTGYIPDPDVWETPTKRRSKVK